jgi:hypothetical protein
MISNENKDIVTNDINMDDKENESRDYWQLLKKYNFLKNNKWFSPNRKMYLTIDNINQLENTWIYIEFNWSQMKQWNKWREMNLPLLIKNTRYHIRENDDDWYFSNDYYPHNPYSNFYKYDFFNEQLLYRNHCSGYMRQIHNNIIRDVYRYKYPYNKYEGRLQKFSYFIRILPYQICLNLQDVSNDKPIKIFIELSFDTNQWFDQCIESLQIRYCS